MSIRPRTLRAFPPAVLLLAALAACTPSPEPPDDEIGSGPATAAPAAEPRPPSIVDTITLEGMPEEVRLSLFRTPEGFTLPFSAYVPAGFAPEVLETDSGGAVRFVSELGGVRNERALLHLLIHPAGTPAGEVVPAARAYAASRGIPVSQGEGDDEPDAPPRFDWSLVEYPFDDESTPPDETWGVIAVGRHADRFFHVLLRYPPEYADGFPARAGMILETLRWEDTGRGLERGEPLQP